MLTFPVSITQAKVHQANGTVIVDQQVFRFEVTMDDVELVDVLNASYDLLEDCAGLVFGDPEWKLGYLHKTWVTSCI